MIVNCVYRIHSRGVVLDGKFDTDEGLILECPELCQVDMTDYHYILDAYPGVGDSMEYLHYMLQDASCAIAAIGFNRVGCILVGYEEAHAVYAVRGNFPDVAGALVKKYRMKTECIGIARTEVRQFVVPTKRALVVIDKTGNEPVIHTQQGRKKVAFSYDSLEPGETIGLQGAKELCEDSRAYGICKVKGEVRLLTIGSSDIEYL